jgi:NitT/TauT family transport system substrate-binding protein
MSQISRRATIAMLAAAAVPARAATPSPLRVGLLHTVSPAPLYLAMERGYFTAENQPAEFRFFEAAQPIAAAAVSGDIDIGLTALTGGFFSLAGRGALKVIGGGLHEEKGIPGTAILVSKKAWDDGLTSLAKIAGHSVGITQYGASFHYITGRIAQAAGFDLKSVTLRPLQTLANMQAAVQTGQVDVSYAIASQAVPLEKSGEVHILGWVGDVVPYQLTAVFAPSRMLTGKDAAVAAFCRAYGKGVDDVREAFLRPDGKGGFIRDAKTDAAIPQIAKYVYPNDPDAAAKIIGTMGYYDAGGALDVADVGQQLQWFIAQGLVRGPIDPVEIIDTRFLPTLKTQ